MHAGGMVRVLIKGLLPLFHLCPFFAAILVMLESPGGIHSLVRLWSSALRAA